MEQLLQEYSSNCNMANALALDTVSKIGIPIYSRLSSLSRQDFTKLVYNVCYKCKKLSATEKCLILTLVTDAVTIMIKNQELYETFHGNNSVLIDLLCKQYNCFDPLLVKDVSAVLEYLNQMLKYAERIPEYPKLKQSLEVMKYLSVSKNSTSENNKVIPIYISKENNPPNTLYNINNNIIFKIINVNPKNVIIAPKKPRNAFEILMDSGKNKKKNHL